MSLITDDWRLKLLAVGLAVLMLGAVAFSQNPPTTRTLQIPLNYTMPPNLILIKPPTKTIVTYSGLADVISSVTPDRLVAVVDATHASPGPAVKLNVTASSTIAGVNVQNPGQIVVNIDSLVADPLPVQVIAHAAPGWSVTKAVAMCPGGLKVNPCTVQFVGPQSWGTPVNLKAVVDFSAPVQANTYDTPNEPIELQNSNGAVDLSSCTTVPCAKLDVTAAAIHIDAQTGVTSSTVALVDAPPSNPPPSGYRVTGVTIDPVTLIIIGDPIVLGKIQRITLPPVDLSKSNSTATFKAQIPYPAGVSGSVGVATITYQIAANPNVSPSP
ncbi:MAG: CdaR family protein [Candidatus Dormibacteraceae bacterium]